MSTIPSTVSKRATLTDEQKQKMKEGRERAAAEKLTAEMEEMKKKMAALNKKLAKKSKAEETAVKEEVAPVDEDPIGSTDTAPVVAPVKEEIKAKKVPKKKEEIKAKKVPKKKEGVEDEASQGVAIEESKPKKERKTLKKEDDVEPVLTPAPVQEQPAPSEPAEKPKKTPKKKKEEEKQPPTPEPVVQQQQAQTPVEGPTSIVETVQNMSLQELLTIAAAAANKQQPQVQTPTVEDDSDDENKELQFIAKKKAIPKHVKTLVWNKYIGADKAKAPCMSCRQADISIRSFHCGHVIAEAKGGDMTINNLRPICADCNLAMGTMSMNEFTSQFFGWNI